MIYSICTRKTHACHTHHIRKLAPFNLSACQHPNSVSTHLTKGGRVSVLQLFEFRLTVKIPKGTGRRRYRPMHYIMYMCDISTLQWIPDFIWSPTHSLESEDTHTSQMHACTHTCTAHAHTQSMHAICYLITSIGCCGD